MAESLIPVIQAILQDNEFLAGGIFTKEKYYADKYNLNMEQIRNIEVCLYYALNINIEDYNRRVNRMCDML